MAPLIEQKLRELLTKAWAEGFNTAGSYGGSMMAASSFIVEDASCGLEESKPAISELMLEVWKLLTYHAGRGDAATAYIEGPGKGQNFRWHEVLDIMLSVPLPEHMGGDPAPESAPVPIQCKRIEYSFDEETGNIVLPNAAPFDGQPVLIKLAHGWVEAWWQPAEKAYAAFDGESATGFCWVCMDDDYAEQELDSATYWAPLPTGDDA